MFRKPYKDFTRTPLRFPEKSRTKQAFKEECDVNNIMRRARETGIAPGGQLAPWREADFTALPSSYHEALNQVLEAEATFGLLPSAIRKRFNNDPGEFLNFATNPENGEELISLGLATRVLPDAVRDAPQTGGSGGPAGPQGGPSGAPEASPPPPPGRQS